MNEWGLPDWRNPSAYGAVEEWTYDRWRWEFKRRLPELRDYFDEELAKTEASGTVVNATFFKPSDPGFVVDVDVEAAQRFGYSHGIPNPRIGEQPEWVLKSFPLHTLEGGVIKANQPRLGDRLDLEALNEEIGHLQSAAWEFGMSGHESRDLMNAAPNEIIENYMRRHLLQYLGRCHLVDLGVSRIAIQFDLDAPLAEQLDAAEAILKKDQIQRHGKKLQRRSHPKKWLEYLRTLDAHEAGASWQEIASIRPHTAKTEHTALETWKAADALRSNF